MPSMVKIDPVVLENKMKNVNSLQTDGQTDGFQLRLAKKKRKADNSF